MKQILFLLFFLPLFMHAQTSQYELGSSSGTEYVQDVVFDTTDNSTIHVGYVNVSGSGGNGQDPFIMKVGSNKAIIWQKKISSTGNDFFYRVKTCSNGDYIAVGEVRVSGARRGLIVRFNGSTGNIVWASATSISSTWGDTFFDVIETSNGNIAVAGATNHGGSGTSNGLIILYNSSGTELWTRRGNAPTADWYGGINQLPNGNLIVVGSVWGGSNYTGLITEMDLSGTVINNRSYTISQSISGVNTTINSLWVKGCYIRNNIPIVEWYATTGPGNNSLQAAHTYNVSTGALTGAIYYYTTSLPIAATFYPLTSTDYIVSQTPSSVQYPTVSLISSGVVTYTRKVDSQNKSMYGTAYNPTNNALVFTGINNSGDIYSLFSQTSFPASATPCRIIDTTALSLLSSNLSPTNTSITYTNLTATNNYLVVDSTTNYQYTKLCGSDSGHEGDCDLTCYWKTNGNTISSQNFLGTINSDDLRIRTNNNQVAVFDVQGQLGIGTGTPTAQLHTTDQKIRHENLQKTDSLFPPVVIDKDGYLYIGSQSALQNTCVTPNTVPKVIDANGTLACSMIHENGTGVGIDMVPGTWNGGGAVVSGSPSLYTPVKLDVNGLTRTTTLVVTSDKNLKSDIKKFSNASEIVDKLNPVSYSWKNKEQDGRQHYGFLAQELEKVLPNLVITDDKGIQAINYIELIPLLTKSISEQNKRISDLENQLNTLMDEYKNLAECCSQKNGVAVNSIDHLHQATPNPTTGLCRISYTLVTKDKQAYILLKDINGRTLNTYNISQKNDAGYIDLQMSQYSSGLYYYSLVVDNQILSTKKIVLSK